MKVLGYGSGVETAPGVYASERDETVAPQGGSSTTAAIAGLFQWGPVNYPKLISNEDQLAFYFGQPSNLNAEGWFVAANYLAYASSLYVNRTGNTASGSDLVSAVSNNAVANSATLALHTIENHDDYDVKSPSFTSAIDYIARYPGAMGNSLRLSICPSANAFKSTANLASATYGANVAFTVGSNQAVFTMAANTTATAIKSLFVPGDVIAAGNTSLGTQSLKVLAVGNTVGNTVSVTLDNPYRLSDNYSDVTITRSWEFANLVSGPPTTSAALIAVNNTAVDTVHFVVVDQNGLFGGRPGAVVEIFENLSRATDATTATGESLFFKNFLNNNSDFIWTGSAPSVLTTGLATNINSLNAVTAPINTQFSLGADGPDENTVPLGVILRGYDRFAHRDDFDLTAFIVGKSRGGALGEQTFNYAVDNLGEVRKDLIVYGSLPKTVVVGNKGNELNAAISFRGNLHNSSYWFLDTGYKYQYDKYNDLFRWIPLCGDTAGLSTYSDVEFDPWYAGAGLERGGIKNIVRLAWNPTPAEQKVAFGNAINNVITIRGNGTFVMGDKTGVGFNSAMDQIGARKTLNLIKSALLKSSRTTMFRLNNEFTQQRFKNQVNPFLRDIQGRQGIVQFTAVCDGTNNTQTVLNSKRFVADISIEFAHTIRTVQLNFVSINGVAEINETL
jgi:hypothetical protein